MLKGIDPLLTPELLWVLAAMGHGDDIALVDSNHPAERVARTTGASPRRSCPSCRSTAATTPRGA
jgi:L-fucose mutarotase